MARTHKPSGPCHICGITGPLTFEHLPPRKALNEYPVVGAHLDQLINTHPADYVGRKHRDFQSGFGKYTLCGPCNNNTGSWYAREFVSWVDQSLRILRRTGNAVGDIVECRFDIYPLRVIKQICAMFLSLNDSSFRDAHEYLADFVLNRYKVGLNPAIQISAYLTPGPHLRYAADMLPQHMPPDSATPDYLGAMIDEAGTIMERKEHPLEISFPPLGYAMTFMPDMSDHSRANVSHFSLYGYNQKASLTIRMPILPVYTWYYGDYRTLDQLGSRTNDPSATSGQAMSHG